MEGVGYDPERDDKVNSNIKLYTDVRQTNTYKRLLKLIVEEGISNLPKDVTDILGYDYILPFKEGLIRMRERGYAFCYYQNGEILFNENIGYEKVSECGEDIYSNYRFRLRGEELNSEDVIVFGSFLRQEEARFIRGRREGSSVLMYENSLLKFYSKGDNSYAWIMKIKDYSESKISKKNYLKGVASKVKGILNRSNNSSLILDSEDDFSSTQMDLGWFKDYIQEYKIKICADFDIPYSKLFGEGATGLNATGEGDKDSWYDRLVAFQSIYIYPALKRLAEIKGVAEEFKKIQWEQISTEDRERNMMVDTQQMNMVNMSYSIGIIKYEEARKKALEILGISEVGGVEGEYEIGERIEEGKKFNNNDQGEEYDRRK